MDRAYAEKLADWDYDRRMAFKNIMDRWHAPRRRRIAMMDWLKANPSPKSARDKSKTTDQAIWDACANAGDEYLKMANDALARALARGKTA